MLCGWWGVQVVVDLVWVVLLPLVFTSMYYYTSLPEMPFGTYYAAAAGVCWWLSGCAYLVAALLPIKSTTVTGGPQRAPGRWLGSWVARMQTAAAATSW
jgi:hypothetical protein